MSARDLFPPWAKQCLEGHKRDQICPSMSLSALSMPGMRKRMWVKLEGVVGVCT